MTTIVVTAMIAGMTALDDEAGWLANDEEALPKADVVVDMTEEPIDDEVCVLDVVRPFVE